MPAAAARRCRGRSNRGRGGIERTGRGGREQARGDDGGPIRRCRRRRSRRAWDALQKVEAEEQEKKRGGCVCERGERDGKGDGDRDGETEHDKLELTKA